MTQKEVLKFLANSRIYVNGKGKEILKKLVELGCKSGEVNTDLPLLAIDCNNTIHNVNPMWKFIYLYKEIDADEILSLVVTEPSYRPFKDKEECCKILTKHHPFGWLRDNYQNCYRNITVVYDDKIELAPYFNGYGEIFKDTILYKDALKRISFFDGTPFGIKEE